MQTRPRADLSPPAALLVVTAGAVAVTELARSDALEGGWSTPGDPVAIVTQVVSGLALGVGALGVVGIAAGLLARLGPFAAVLRRVECCALRQLRGFVEAALGAWLAVWTIAPTAVLAAPRDDEPVVRAPYAATTSSPATSTAPATTATTTTTTTAGTDTTPAPPPATERPPSGLPSEHVVQPGDHLWGIAEARLARLGVGDGTPSARDIAPYWARVIAANRATLRSGDPNLIFPGEVVVLPALT